MDLNEKKILLIAPHYYHYEKFIIDGLGKMGATVVYRENRAFQHDPINKGTTWFLSLLCKKKDYISEVLIPATRERYDICLFIDLFAFDPRLLDNLKAANPSIRCILYLWDNIRGYRWEQFFSLFDMIYSFDPVESKEYDIRYFPNFFPSVPGNENAITYDVSFVGSLQVHRLKLLERLAKQLKKENKTFFFFLYLHPNYNRLKFNVFVYTLLKFFPGRFSGYKYLFEIITKRKSHPLVFFTPLPVTEAVQIIARSTCMLDLPFPTQTGSTQRLIQALALNKKVVTTNASVVQDSFYNEDYIKVVSFDHFNIDWDWVNKKIPSKYDLSHLSIDRWLSKLLS